LDKKTPVIFLGLLLVLSNFLVFYTMSLPSEKNSNISFSYTDPNKVDIVPVSLEKSIEYLQSSYTTMDRRGAQNFAVICVHPSDHLATRWTIPQHEDIMKTINDFYVNASDGAISINYQVEGWYDLGNNWNHYGSIDAGSLVVNDWKTVVRDAIDLADGDIDFNNYDYVIVWINTAWWRGWASIGQNININTDEGAFTIAATLCGENAGTDIEQVWGRAAHEMGHLFGLQHTHGSNKDGTKNYDSWYSLMARAYPSAMNTYSKLFDGTGWFNTGNNMEIIASGGSDSFHVRPRHLDIEGDIQALKVKISDSVYYMVEVIEQKSEDAWLPDEGVYIYIVDKNEPNDDECTDQDGNPGTASVNDCLYDVGDTFTDVAHGIYISVDSFSFDGFDISVTNAADGASDLMITKWGNPPGHPGPYETPDIWCDSPVNGYGHYRHRDGNDNPIGIGDEPLLNEFNRLYARIWNIGDVDASGVTVTFYENKPIGVGDSGTWGYIGEATVNVPKGTSRTCYALWKPSYNTADKPDGLQDIHSCVKVVISKHIAEDDTGNNLAQENIGTFEVLSTGAPVPNAKLDSRFGPVTGTFNIVNPFKEYKNIYINVVDVTPGWNVTGINVGEIVNFAPGEKIKYDIEIIPGPDIEFTDKVEAHLIACVEVVPNDDPSFIGDIHLMPYGGVTISATVVYRSQLDINAKILSDTKFEVYGSLSFLDGVPANIMPTNPGDRLIYLNIENKDNSYDKYNATLSIDETGDYKTQITLKQGVYKVRGFYAGSEFIACDDSVTLMVDLIATSVWTSKLFPGFTLFASLGALIGVSSIVGIISFKSNKRYK